LGPLESRDVSSNGMAPSGSEPAEMRVGVLAASLIGLLPMALLGAVGSSFAVDWTNTVWMVAYVGEWYARHGTFPVVLNTHQIVGVPYPVYYGFVFLPIAGFLSVALGGDLAVRVLCALVSVAQAAAIIAAARRFAIPRWVAWTVAAMYCWRVYALTNLYNRSDVAEFVAFGLLSIAVMSWIAFVKDRWSATDLIPGLAFALASGTHALTAVFGGGMLCLIFVAVVFHTKDRRRIIAVFGANAILAFIVLAPWLCGVAAFKSRLQIAISPPGLVYFPFDTLLVRILPFPLDPRSVVDGIHVSTPYLDAQIAAPLAAFAIALLFLGRRRRRLRAQALIVAAVAVLLMSTTPEIGSAVSFLARLQYPYRLVNYVDLLLLLAIFASFSQSESGDAATLNGPRYRFLIVVCLTLSAVGLLMKFEHGFAITRPGLLAGTGLGENRGALLELPPNFYGLTAYADPTGMTGALQNPSAVLPVEGGSAFGDVGGAVGTSTNIQAFGWNRILVRGMPASLGHTTFTPYGPALTLKKRAQMTYSVSPPWWWSVMRALSGFVLLFWALAIPILLLRLPKGQRTLEVLDVLLLPQPVERATGAVVGVTSGGKVMLAGLLQPLS
jgi:hypothetical protein